MSSSSFYKERKSDLSHLIKRGYPDKKGVVLLAANFESHCSVFRQESSFFYITGIEEPAVIWTYNLESHSSELHIPEYKIDRSAWAHSCVYGNDNAQSRFDLDRICILGDAYKGYSLPKQCSLSCFNHIISSLKEIVARKEYIFTPLCKYTYPQQYDLMQRFITYVPELADYLIDISDIIAFMRRTKSRKEIELMYEAINVTIDAHEAAARVIVPGKKEYNIQAAIEFIFTDSGCKPAFPSIIASGSHSTILHATDTSKEIQKNDLVIVDIGAEYNHYCADISRTYPASGSFTKRQKEVYNIVLDTQEHVAQYAQPGYYIKNDEYPDKSLYHIAVAFLKSQGGYDTYFMHNIGHYIGLDVHDVGSYKEPLKEGDVITIEPGVYIKDEHIGIRIEDNYWIIKGGSVCLTEHLPKDSDSIEQIVAKDMKHF
jgi:Xaa-Pro aminopeptidase